MLALEVQVLRVYAADTVLLEGDRKRIDLDR